MAMAVAVIAIFLTEPAFAQWFNVRGTVYESSTLKPLPGANVAVNDSTGKLVAGRQTQNNGQFMIPGIPVGKYTLKVSFMGFKTQSFQLDLSGKGGNKKVQDVLLREDATLMTEAVVEGKLPEMTIVDDTVMYNAAAFSLPPGAMVEDLIKKLPGILLHLRIEYKFDEGRRNMCFCIRQMREIGRHKIFWIVYLIDRHFQCRRKILVKPVERARHQFDSCLCHLAFVRAYGIKRNDVNYSVLRILRYDLVRLCKCKLPEIVVFYLRFEFPPCLLITPVNPSEFLPEKFRVATPHAILIQQGFVVYGIYGTFLSIRLCFIGKEQGDHERCGEIQKPRLCPVMLHGDQGIGIGFPFLIIARHGTEA